MLIDWFTVVAQAVNFLILVWLLKRFLYVPVLGAIDAREKKIAAQLAQATQAETQARTEREEFQRRNEMLAQERETILRKANEAAEAERQRLMEMARQDAQSQRARFTEVLTKERQELGRQLAARTQAEVFELTRKALGDLAGVAIESRMVEVFMENLSALPESRRKLVNAAATGPAGIRSARAAVVRSAFEIKPAQRAAIEQGVLQCLGPEVAVRFERSSQLVCGVELTLDDVKLAWSVTDYLSRVVQEILELTAATAVPTPEARHG